MAGSFCFAERNKVMKMAIEREVKTEEKNLKKTKNLFSKEQLLASERFQDRKDLLNVLLSADKQYTVEEVEQKMEQYEKGEVK